MQASLFLDRLLDQYRAGNTREGLLLTNVCTDTAWFAKMWALPLCFVRGRLSFSRAGHAGGSPRYANVIAYVGRRYDVFDDVFKTLGHIVLPRRTSEKQH
jgi:hypothetical protein